MATHFTCDICSTECEPLYESQWGEVFLGGSLGGERLTVHTSVRKAGESDKIDL